MAIKRITVEQAQALLTAIDNKNQKYGIRTEFADQDPRDQCIVAESIFEAVDEHRVANRVPRPPKVVG